MIMEEKKRILIIDDSPSQLYGMQKIVEKLGHETLLTEDGKEGIQIAREQLPDLILMDVGMPNIDGYKLCSLIRKYSAFQVPCNLLTRPAAAAAVHSRDVLSPATQHMAMAHANKKSQPEVCLQLQYNSPHTFVIGLS